MSQDGHFHSPGFAGATPDRQPGSTPDDAQNASTNAAPNAAEWLAEVRALQQQVIDLQAARDRAYASADNLRQLYDAEAQQRRREAADFQRRLDRLQKALTAVQTPQGMEVGQLKTEISRIQSNRSVEQLQAQLVSSRQQCEQLKRLLSDEQAAHEETRQSLTTALGDAVDLLAKERGALETEQ